jgi:YbbR domain-containing protein
MAWHPLRNLGLKVLSVVLATLLWMTVTRDQTVERNLRVPLEFQEIPEDLEITGDTLTAVDVRVRGASSILSRLEGGEVVAVLNLQAARPGQRLFHVLTDEVRVPFGVTVVQVNPPTVPLRIERSGSRTVPVHPTVEGQPADGYVAGAVKVSPPAVEVVGPLSRLSSVREATTEPVSIANATATVSDSVTVGVVDPGLRLRVPRNATVIVEIQPAPIERDFKDLVVSVRNVGPRLRAAVVPARVTVVLRGSRQTLGSMDAGTLSPWVDAAALKAGRYSLPVRVDPGGEYTVLRVEPAQVQLRLR